TTTAMLTVQNGNVTDPAVAPVLIGAQGDFSLVNATSASIDFQGESVTGEDTNTGILASVSGSLAFDWHGTYTTTVTISLSSPSLAATTLSITVQPQPPVAFQWSADGSTDNSGLNSGITTIVMSGTTASVTATAS